MLIALRSNGKFLIILTVLLLLLAIATLMLFSSGIHVVALGPVSPAIMYPGH